MCYLLGYLSFCFIDRPDQCKQFTLEFRYIEYVFHKFRLYPFNDMQTLLVELKGKLREAKKIAL